MKRKIQITIVLSILLLNAALIFGQEKLIEKKEYDEIIQKAYTNLDGKTLRGIIYYEEFADRNSSPTKTSKNITEFVPPDRFRWISERNGEKSEVIQIGPKRYVRINNGEWKEETLSGIGSGIGSGGGARIENQSYKLFENSVLDGKKVNLYERIETLTDFSTRNDSGKEIWTRKTWITKDGLLIKVQDEYETVEKKSLRRSITTYEYDANIKIEAPKITSKKT